MKDYIEIDGKQVQLPNLAIGAEYPFVSVLASAITFYAIRKERGGKHGVHQV